MNNETVCVEDMAKEFADMNRYQELSKTTAMYIDRMSREMGIYYVVLGLASEAGEVAGKLKKALRDNGGQVDTRIRSMMLDELGDVLWYVAQVCEELGFPMGAVARMNLNKLFDREDRGVLAGSGDNR